MKVTVGNLTACAERLGRYRGLWALVPIGLLLCIFVLVDSTVVYNTSSASIFSSRWFIWLIVATSIIVAVIVGLAGMRNCSYCHKRIREYQPAISMEWEEETKHSLMVVRASKIFHEKCHHEAVDDKKFKMPPPFDDVQL